MAVLPWSERKLPFGKSLDELPLLLERMIGTPARLWQLARAVPRERLTLSRSGSWSAMEHMVHLTFLDERMDDRVEDFMARRATLCRIDMGAQEGVMARNRGRDPGDLLEEFRLGRNALVERIRSMDPGALRHCAQHPCMGRLLRPVDMAMYLAEHDDHHLALMRGLLTGRPDLAVN